MHRGFSISLSENELREIVKQHHKSGQKSYDWGYGPYAEKDAEEVRRAVDDYLKSVSGSFPLQGEYLETAYFPKRAYHVFISHSSSDKDVAMRFAGFLKLNFDLDCFVDSTVWGYYEDLVDQVFRHVLRHTVIAENKKVELRKTVSTHVHCMLEKSLVQIMDDSECLFFLNTPNSVHCDSVRDKTFSPWIYSEIEASRVLRDKSHKDRKRSVVENFSQNGAIRDFIEYPLNTGHLVKLTSQDVSSWLSSLSYSAQRHPELQTYLRDLEGALDLNGRAFKALDCLYAKFPVPALKNLNS